MKKLWFKKWLCIGLSLVFLLAGAIPTYAYQALELNGSGYTSIADGSQAGLDLGYGDFILEARIKSVSAAKQGVIYKSGTGGYYNFHINVTTGFLECVINDGTNTATSTSDVKVNNNQWHYVAYVADISSATGGRIYVDGTEDTTARADVSAIAGIDNDGVFYIGYDGTDEIVGWVDCVRVWNFGYNGLPADYATYITWRAQGRNVFLDISEYDGDAWAGYADAVRTEEVTDSGIENWTGDTPDAWVEGAESPGVRDITKELIEIHGGTSAAKLEATLNDGTVFYVGATTSLQANKYYELKGWRYVLSRTVGRTYVIAYNHTDGYFWLSQTSTTDASYVQAGGVFKPTISANDVSCRIYDETTTGVVYFDDISVKRVGLVGHWKFEGGYTDETSNSNDLTAGGTGNTFPGYALKRQRIISPATVN